MTTTATAARPSVSIDDDTARTRLLSALARVGNLTADEAALVCHIAPARAIELLRNMRENGQVVRCRGSYLLPRSSAVDALA